MSPTIVSCKQKPHPVSPIPCACKLEQKIFHRLCALMVLLQGQMPTYPAFKERTRALQIC